MNEIKDRVKSVRDRVALTQTAFGERIGVSRSIVASYEGGAVEPPEIAIKAICHKFGVDYEWLKYGDGEMFASAEDETLAALDELMSSEDHKETRAFIKALGGLNEDELVVIDKLIASIKKELGY